MSTILDTISPTKVRTMRIGLFGLLAVGFAYSSLSPQLWGVPLTLQTLMLLVISFTAAAWGGWRAALATVAAGIGLALSIGTIPLARVPLTGGYLAGMLLAAPLVAWLAQAVFRRAVTGWRVALRLALVGAAGLAVVLACGWAWLAFGGPSLGAARAWTVGVVPFLIGAGVKLALAVTIAMLARPLLRRG